MEHLQTIIKEFDLIAGYDEEFLICYFQDSLQLPIQAQINSQNRELNFLNKIFKKTIDAKAKASLQPVFDLQKIDFYYY